MLVQSHQLSSTLGEAPEQLSPVPGSAPNFFFLGEHRSHQLSASKGKLHNNCHLARAARPKLFFSLSAEAIEFPRVKENSTTTVILFGERA